MMASLTRLWPLLMSLLSVSLLPVTSLRASDLVSIERVLSYGEAYNLRSVALQGVVHNVTPVPPHLPSNPRMGCMIYGAYTFWLIDDTGSIYVEVEGSCYGRKPVVTVSEGDRVTVHVRILAWDRNGTARKDVKGEALAITKQVE